MVRFSDHPNIRKSEYLISKKMTKQQIIENFDPSQPGLADATVFGLPFSAEQSEIIVVPVPWEVTVSYGAGASEGPDAIMEASFQVDLNHQELSLIHI